MGWIFMIVCCFAWGVLCGKFIENKVLSLSLGGIGGFAIGQLFQSAGLL